MIAVLLRSLSPPPPGEGHGEGKQRIHEEHEGHEGPQLWRLVARRHVFVNFVSFVDNMLWLP